jgi:hypothetical protein
MTGEELIAFIEERIAHYKKWCDQAWRTNDNDGYVNCEVVDDLEKILAALQAKQDA